MDIFLHTSPLVKYTRNTDNRYLLSFLKGDHYFPDIHFDTEHNCLIGGFDLCQLLGSRILSKIGVSAELHPSLYRCTCLSYLPSSVFRHHHYGAILSHGCFPISNCDRLPPIIWETGMLGLEHLYYFYPQTETAERAWKIEIEVKQQIGQQAALIGISYPAAADRFRDLLPSLAEKVRVLPHFLPHLKLSDWNSVVRKYTHRSKIKLTFVGNQAKRKGLADLYQALQRLSPNLQDMLEITVVSSFLDGFIPTPPHLSITYCCDLQPSEINSILESTHIYCMPSRSESYGLVYVEAMAAGCTVIAPRREAQNYLLDRGKSGLLVEPNNIEALVSALMIAITEPENCLQLARNAWERVQTHLGPEAAAVAYRSAFQELAS
jgi:glycosyltransferase involved in cell wall biosynthesis